MEIGRDGKVDGDGKGMRMEMEGEGKVGWDGEWDGIDWNWDRDWE